MICPAAEKKKTAAGQADSPCLYFIPCGGFHFSKPPLFIGHSHDFSNAKPITVGPICYRLCVCASGSMVDVFSCRTLINISCLHLGQCSGNLSRTVSSYTFIRVFPPQAGQHIQWEQFCVAFICTTLCYQCSGDGMEIWAPAIRNSLCSRTAITAVTIAEIISAIGCA